VPSISWGKRRKRRKGNPTCDHCSLNLHIACRIRPTGREEKNKRRIMKILDITAKRGKRKKNSLLPFHARDRRKIKGKGKDRKKRRKYESFPPSGAYHREKGKKSVASRILSVRARTSPSLIRKKKKGKRESLFPRFGSKEGGEKKTSGAPRTKAQRSGFISDQLGEEKGERSILGLAPKARGKGGKGEGRRVGVVISTCSMRKGGRKGKPPHTV